MKNFLVKNKRYAWGLAWLVLLLLGVDFYNWGEAGIFIFGLPLWLWRLVALVLLIALVYGLLSRVSWEED